jgi:adenosylhomocysteine nucleosidase
MSDRQTLIAVVGLQFEARIADGICTRVVCRGDVPSLAASLARAITKGCHGLIRLGVAGGLSPDLPPGACVIGSEILCGTTRLMTDRNWSQNLLQVIPDSIYGKIVGVPDPIAYPETKRALYQNTGAVAVDMESHVVASIAAANGLPFIAIRIITDPAKRVLPKVALAAMRPNGTINFAAMLRSLMKHPDDLGLLIQTAHDAFAALATLSRVALCLSSATDIFRNCPKARRASLAVAGLPQA